MMSGSMRYALWGGSAVVMTLAIVGFTVDAWRHGDWAELLPVLPLASAAGFCVWGAVYG